MRQVVDDPPKVLDQFCWLMEAKINFEHELNEYFELYKIGQKKGITSATLKKLAVRCSLPTSKKKLPNVEF